MSDTPNSPKKDLSQLGIKVGVITGVIIATCAVYTAFFKPQPPDPTPVVESTIVPAPMTAVQLYVTLVPTSTEQSYVPPTIDQHLNSDQNTPPETFGKAKGKPSDVYGNRDVNFDTREHLQITAGSFVQLMNSRSNCIASLGNSKSDNVKKIVFLNNNIRDIERMESASDALRTMARNNPTINQAVKYIDLKPLYLKKIQLLSSK